MTRRRAFTLIELLIVVAIIMVLIVLLMPAVQHAREAARRSQCRSNLHNIGLALLNYESTYKCFPPGWLTSREGKWVVPGYSSWMIAILPEIEQGGIYNSINANLPGWNPANKTAVIRRLEVYLCPSDPNNKGQFRFNWLGEDVTLAYA